ncbi:MAG: DNA repair protein rad5 [Sarcosagium campestre]|nr:MAG: DNA repair protein rad5 [Sarcosagium campestre]
MEMPPAKKRRFFAETSAGIDVPALKHAFPTNASAEAVVQTAPISRDGSSSQNTPSQSTPAQTEEDSPGTGEFDTQLLKSIIGIELPADTLRHLRDASANDMERAVNMYLDGSWQEAKQILPSRTAPNSTLGAFGITPSNIASVKPAKDNEVPPMLKSQVGEHPQYRYIGAFGVGAWATRSGYTLVKHDESVNIERQKASTPPSKSGRGKAGPNKPKRQDIVVRFTNGAGSEVGRLPRETAAWVAPLIDQGICTFTGKCVYAPTHVRVNDTIYIQLRVSLLHYAFESRAFSSVDGNRTTGIFEAKETEEEQNLRLRQYALVKLFEEISLQPTKTNDLAEKHKRQGLLQVAEMSEQHQTSENDPKADQTDNDASSPPSSSEAEDGKELEQDQLDTLYKKAQSFDFNTPAAEPAATFQMDLRQYQKQALHWMIGKEKNEKAVDRETSIHPLWEEYRWPLKDVDDKVLPVLPEQNSFYINPYSGELSLDFPRQEQNCLGGILADEMGLGKTIEMLSLMHSHKSDVAMASEATTSSSVTNLPRLPKKSSSVEYAPCTTLVVAPMSLLAQWQSEAENASAPGTLKSVVYYGNEKSANLQTLCCETKAASAPQLVITSYGVVLSEFGQVAANGGNRGSHGGLFSLDFFRVILDEGHHIKNRQSKTAKACYEISAKHRWVLTGTPIVNRLEDLFSLVHFLKVEPWSNFSFWKTFITVPFESKDFIKALDVVQTVLEPLVLRRTKDMKTPDGEALVPLPPRTIEIEEIELSKPEREVYDHIFTRAKRTFNANVEAGTLLKSYTTIFAQILRLRQSCCHPILTRNQAIVAEEEDAAAVSDLANGLADDMDLQKLIERFKSEEGEQDANKYGAHVLKQIQDESSNECPICSDEPMNDQAVTGCWHSACKKCLLDYVEHQKAKGDVPRCFNCRERIIERDIFEVIRHDYPPSDSDDLYSDAQAPSGSKNHITLRRIGANSSAKIASLVQHLKAIRRADPGMKSVVFSQFTSFLDLIEPALTRDNIAFLRFDGSMSQKQRAAVLAEFARPSKGVVLLLSLRAGGVGLNLTHAKRVFMMDPWWSFAVEAQAIDRVHRMGQDAPVKIFRFIVKESVEHRMLKIQDRKKFIASSLGMMSDEEKKTQRIEDIKELLS